jgi:hypothetical protein
MYSIRAETAGSRSCHSTSDKSAMSANDPDKVMGS